MDEDDKIMNMETNQWKHVRVAQHHMCGDSSAYESYLWSFPGWPNVDIGFVTDWHNEDSFSC
jgi:hypothetical protein